MPKAHSRSEIFGVDYSRLQDLHLFVSSFTYYYNLDVPGRIYGQITLS